MTAIPAIPVPDAAPMRDASLLVSTADLTAILAASEATIARWDASGKMPRPIRLGRKCKKWRRSDIVAWVSMGCPSRRDFEALIAAK